MISREELGKVLKLPSRRWLRDYKNVIKPNAGFNQNVIKKLISIKTLVDVDKLASHALGFLC